MLRALAAYPDAARTPSFGPSPFTITTLHCERTACHGLDKLRAHAAYLGRLWRKRGEPYHDGNIRSAGLRTAPGPRFRTWV
jgi:hypothetical protein